MARELADASINSFGWAKQLLNDSLNNSLEFQLEQEWTAIASCASHPDGQEGMRAFIEKHKPAFRPKSSQTP